MPRGTRLVLTRSFRAKRERHCIFLEEKAIIITFKHRTTTFSSHDDLFLGNFNEKLARKASVNTERVPPGHPTILLKSNWYNMPSLSVKRSVMGFRCTWWRNLGTQLKPLPRGETTLIGGPVLTWVWITPMQRPNHRQRRSQSFPPVREVMWNLTSHAQYGNGEVVSPIMGCLFAQLTSWKLVDR